MTAEDKDARYGPVVARVNSKSQPDKIYEVRRHVDGHLTCNCKGWIFNREQPKRCTHTDAVGGTFTRWKLSMDRRAGVGVPEDRATKIVKELLGIGGFYAISSGRTDPTPGTIARMAGALRQYLRADEMRVVPDPTAVAARANDLLLSGPRMITLDD